MARAKDALHRTRAAQRACVRVRSKTCRAASIGVHVSVTTATAAPARHAQPRAWVPPPDERGAPVAVLELAAVLEQAAGRLGGEGHARTHRRLATRTRGCVGVVAHAPVAHVVVVGSPAAAVRIFAFVAVVIRRNDGEDDEVGERCARVQGRGRTKTNMRRMTRLRVVVLCIHRVGVARCELGAHRADAGQDHAARCRPHSTRAHRGEGRAGNVGEGCGGSVEQRVAAQRARSTHRQTQRLQRPPCPSSSRPSRQGRRRRPGRRRPPPRGRRGC